jgi:hypothetical protein
MLLSLVCIFCVRAHKSSSGMCSAYLIRNFTDVLIASLTDTLAENPQLVNAAREGLLEGSSGNQLLHQLLMLNQASPGGDMASVYIVTPPSTRLENKDITYNSVHSHIIMCHSKLHNLSTS